MDKTICNALQILEYVKEHGWYPKPTHIPAIIALEDLGLVLYDEEGNGQDITRLGEYVVSNAREIVSDKGDRG